MYQIMIELTRKSHFVTQCLIHRLHPIFVIPHVYIFLKHTSCSKSLVKEVKGTNNNSPNSKRELALVTLRKNLVMV